MKQIFNKYFWREPIYKDDVLKVLGTGLLVAILSGILGGALDFLFGLLGIPLMFGLLIVVYMIGSRVSKSYYTYHILYPTLSILFMLVGMFFLTLTKFLCAGGMGIIGALLSDPLFYIRALFEPFYILVISILDFNIFNILISLLNSAVYVWAFMFCFRMVKGRN